LFQLVGADADSSGRLNGLPDESDIRAELI